MVTAGDPTKKMTGAVVSVIIMLKETWVALFPAASVLLQLIVVVPTGNIPPEAGEHEAT